MALTQTLALMIALTGQGTVQQTAPPPGLQQRPASPSEERPRVVVRNHAKSVLPEDASGLYRFGDPDAGRGTNFREGVQINEQFGDVTGYLTIKSGSGKPAFASYFFSRIEGGDGELSFTTKAVHGIWYSFEGKILRGPAATPADNGYYLLTGSLSTHDDTRQTTQQRTVTLKQTAVH